MTTDYAPRTPFPRRSRFVPLVAATLVAGTALVALARTYPEPDVELLPTMSDVVRWTEQGCDTDMDCELWDRWSRLVCENAEACAAALAYGSLSPALSYTVTP